MPTGFGNYHQSEALNNALPSKQNSPQQCNYGLYAEQLSGSAFTQHRHQNYRSWLYRTLPSVVHHDYEPYLGAPNFENAIHQTPNPYRWSPFENLLKPQDFIDGWFYLAGNHSTKCFIYQCNQNMEQRYFSNRDGELLFVPYEGELSIHTEFGQFSIGPGHIAVIPRGVKFKVNVINSEAFGYLCENSGVPLTLPELGLIGANGLAHPRHFFYPEAQYEDIKSKVTLVCKYQQRFWQAYSDHSPLNVVAWHGNYAPYYYDLNLFNTINTVSFDHPDPSIFTVLTSPSPIKGEASLDFVIFPPRWMVATNTFRLPYFHQNVMNELMGLIRGQYDAKGKEFCPGGVSIHNCMTAHGPDARSYQSAVVQKLVPDYYDNTLAFMFEVNTPWQIGKDALEHPARQRHYSDCWKTLSSNFNPNEID